MSRSLLAASALSLLIFSCSPAQALQTDSTEIHVLKAYGAVLASQAGSSQWQQLWKRTRDAGYFDSRQPGFFTVPQEGLPAMVNTVLSAPDAVTAHQTTRAVFRHDFKQPVGTLDSAPVSAICVDVDLRTLPASTSVDPDSDVGTVSLLTAMPCR